MTDRECIRQLRAVRMFCTAQQVAAVDRAIALLVRQEKNNKKSPLS